MSKEKLEELENEEVEDEETEEETPVANTPSNDFKDIVIKECNRIIDSYIEICKGNNDTAFIEALNNPDKTKESCVNHIMNNLTKKRIYGGADSVMYEYIHEYYVDKFTEVKDDWSKWMRTPSGNTGSSTPKKAKLTMKDIEEGYNALSNEDKNRIYLEQLAKYEEEAKKKALEKIKADEAKRKEKELAAKKKAEEQAKKEAERKRKEEEANAPLGGLFDLL